MKTPVVQKWLKRRIASELEIDRGTVARFLRSASFDPNAAILAVGSDGPYAATFSDLPASVAEARYREG
jgi:hypothetical protein